MVLLDHGFAMSRTDSSSTWSSLLSELSASEQSSAIRNENDFHRAFEAFCSDIRERDPQRLLARFLRYHNQIIVFVGALDESTGLDVSNSLSSVFWSKAFATIMVRRLFDLLLAPKLVLNVNNITADSSEDAQ